MVSDVDIARWRLRSQQLTAPSRQPGAQDVVASLLCVQAENPGQSAWAVATRTTEPAAADLAGCLADARVLRTHVLRPTWHYVAAEDVVWLLELTAPRVRRPIVQQLRDSSDLDRAGEVVLEALAEQQLTRNQLAERLAAAGVEVSRFELMLLLADLELQALVCSGVPDGDTHTYALLADRVPSPRRLEREQALAELALRYLTGHGPATERDLAYWATLTLTDVRTGIAATRDRLACFEHDGRTFWHAPGEEPPAGPQQPGAHLLQLLDETYRGYQDSRMVLDAAGAVPRGREAQLGTALVDGQLVARTRRTLTDRRVRFELNPYSSWRAGFLPDVERAAAAYGAFLEREPEVVVAG